MEQKLDEIIELLKIQISILNNIFRMLNTSNDEYLTEMNKDTLELG